MSKKEVEAGVVYVQYTAENLDILSDVASLVLFLNTNEFTSKQITNDDLNVAIAKPKQLSLKKSKSILTKNQTQILDRYISLFTQMQTIPNLDDELMAFEDEISSLQESSPVVKSALTKPVSSYSQFDPVSDVENELAVLSEKETDLLEKEESLFLREKQLEAKELVLAQNITSATNPHVAQLIYHIDEKIMHFNYLVNEYKTHETNVFKTQTQYEKRQKQFEASIAKLARVESDIQRTLVEKQTELDKLQNEGIHKAKELRTQEKLLIQTNKQISKLNNSLQKREISFSAREKDLKKREHILEDAWGKTNELKHEVILKQHSLSQKELELTKQHDIKEQELLALYRGKVTDLEREYEAKLKTLNHELDSFALKKEHFQNEKDSFDKAKHDLHKQQKDMKLLKTKYELQIHNELDSVKSVRTHSVKSHTRKEKHAKDKALESESLGIIRVLLEVADSEISLNPHLAKRTYKRVHELYQHIPFAEQTQIHKSIVSVHGKIQKALSKKKGDVK